MTLHAYSISHSTFPRFSAPTNDHHYYPQSVLQYIFDDNRKKLTIDNLLKGKYTKI